MVEPINYGALQTQIDLSGLQRGLQMRTANRNAEVEARQRGAMQQLARDKFELDEQKDAAYLADVNEWKAKGGTGEGLRDLALRHPDKADQLYKAGDSYDASHKSSMISSISGTLGAIASNKPDLAIKTLEDRSTALEKSGVDASHTRAAIKMLRDGDVAGAKAYLSYTLFGLVGADHAAGIMDVLGFGGKADDKRADNARADAQFAETQRHNRASEGVEAGNLALSRQRERERERERRIARGGGQGGTAAKPPTGFILD